MGEGQEAPPHWDGSGVPCGEGDDVGGGGPVSPVLDLWVHLRKITARYGGDPTVQSVEGGEQVDQPSEQAEGDRPHEHHEHKEVQPPPYSTEEQLTCTGHE